tara:strand:- start:273 stop:452 length:180 start_codon:yes stop_codon:yes gene_type:complete
VSDVPKKGGPDLRNPGLLLEAVQEHDAPKKIQSEEKVNARCVGHRIIPPLFYEGANLRV